MVKMLIDLKSVEDAKRFVGIVRKYDYSIDVFIYTAKPGVVMNS